MTTNRKDLIVDRDRLMNASRTRVATAYPSPLTKTQNEIEEDLLNSEAEPNPTDTIQVMIKGKELTFSAGTHKELRENLECTGLIHFNANKKGGTVYPRIRIRMPNGELKKLTLMRYLAAILEVRQETAGGPRADNKGFIVKPLNGNHFDLRDENIGISPANGSRNTYHAMWSARDRYRRLYAGLPVTYGRRGQTKGEC